MGFHDLIFADQYCTHHAGPVSKIGTVRTETDSTLSRFIRVYRLFCGYNDNQNEQLPPPRDTWNGVLTGYYVGYRAAESGQPYSFKTVETVTNDTQEVTLVGLTKSSRYSVIVKAFNAIGSGPPSEALLVRTLDGGYTLHYKKDTGPWRHIPVVASDDTSYTLTDLDGGRHLPGLPHRLNQFGRGSGSEAIIINTTNQGYERAWVFYKDPSLVVPAASFLIALLVVITVVTVCIKKTKAHKNLEKCELLAWDTSSKK
ncbi:hypothetical protein HPB48_021079 [Haemaphysalis longicornis]|uniref:Fibronectin type-III domain-containing protein n=1 Tax=Haemaphysalis longicornis TaxID=44386 RepID=A0A9J6GZQ6_HAELO|nr:hypothetical protein HPB48_021079 [Haemaphysalis longicornis]